ncbi:hypothetical protein D3C76_1189240 [compost metagenome]
MGWSGKSPVRLPCSLLWLTACCWPSWRQRRRTVLASNTSFTLQCSPASRSLVVSWMLRMESPPRRKKSSSTPRGCLSTPCQMASTVCSSSFCGSPLLCCQTMAGRRRRSSLPLGVSGISGSQQSRAGTMYSGRHSPARCSRASPSGSFSPACRQAYASRRPSCTTTLIWRIAGHSEAIWVSISPGSMR